MMEVRTRSSIIISTYNSPVFLRHVLAGYAGQDCRDFELIVADDGSGAETRELVAAFARSAPFPVEHCWHEDRGFRKCTILNSAIRMAKSDYLIFSDGDCIPRPDFVAVHTSRARPGVFLSGGVEYLSKAATAGITDEMIGSQTLFDPAWLAQNRDRPRIFGKINRHAIVQEFVRRLSPTAPTFNGHNSSAWKKDIVAVNGFDERMAYGGLDRELGERLVNAGIRGESVRYDAVLVHQWHDRPYATQKSWRVNEGIREEVRSQRLSWSDRGIEPGPTRSSNTG